MKEYSMSAQKLTFFIGGREALPVRAVPFVTGGHRFSPVPLVRYLAQEDGLLTGYALRDGKPVAVPASDWDRVLRTLVGFEAQTAEDPAGDFAWLEQVVSKLPAGIFVWLAEFSPMTHGGRHALSAGFEALWNKTFDESYSDTYEKPWQDDPQYAEQGWRTPDPLDKDALILDPLLMDDATRAMVMEGFADVASSKGFTTLVPVVNGGATGITHSTKSRRDALTPVIEQAQRQCRDSQDTAEVWAALQVLAEKKEAPLIGATEDGLQYLKGGEAAIFTRKSLGQRLARLDPATPAKAR